jgi:hypothetical protein
MRISPTTSPPRDTTSLYTVSEHRTRLTLRLSTHQLVIRLLPKRPFFRALSVHSRFRPDLIAASSGTKSAVDVAIYDVKEPPKSVTTNLPAAMVQRSRLTAISTQLCTKSPKSKLPWRTSKPRISALRSLCMRRRRRARLALRLCAL